MFLRFKAPLFFFSPHEACLNFYFYLSLKWQQTSDSIFIFFSVSVGYNVLFCRDVAGMFATLEPLHAMMDKGPQTLKETSFSQAYGNELNEAQKWCKRYKVSNNIRDLNQARTYFTFLS
jgi:hypothetical protein